MRYESVTFGYMLTAASIVLVLGAPRMVAAEDETQARIILTRTLGVGLPCVELRRPRTRSTARWDRLSRAFISSS